MCSRNSARALALWISLSSVGCGDGVVDEIDSRDAQGDDQDVTTQVVAPVPELGVNIHGGGRSIASNEQFAAIMKARNLKTARMDMFWDQDQTLLRDQVQKIRANGGTVEVSLQISYQWLHDCNQDFAYVEQDAYEEAAGAVHKVKDIVHDFELLNETQLRPEIMQEVSWNNVGAATAPYEGKPCVATLASALRGMSRAIRDIRQSSGLPLRTILGVVGRDFGFLTFMQQQGVLFDVVGYHIYPWANQASLLSDPWFGAGGPLAQLAAFGKPVHINELNCGEIYDAAYENQAGASLTEACLAAIDKHLTELRTQTLVDLESIHVYELLDEPSKAAPENRFGLMYDLARPKVHLSLISAFAGGALTAQERDDITSRGLLTDAEIDAMRGATPPPPAPPPPPPVVDSEAPVITITSPANGAVFGRRTTVRVTAAATDNVGVTEVRFILNGTTCVDSSAPYECLMRLPGKRVWTGTLEAQALDAAGNVGRTSIRISAQ